MTQVSRLAAASSFTAASRSRRLGRGGLTISLDGGFEEVVEFFLSRAISASKSAIRAFSGAIAWRPRQRPSAALHLP